MFNWYAAPTFAAMLLFWILGAYVFTRSPLSAVSLTAVAAQFATAAYLLGSGMSANAETIDDMVAWVRGFQWAATVAPTLWLWLTVLLLREQPHPLIQRYLRYAAYPFAIALALVTAFLVLNLYTGDGVLSWSQTFARGPTDSSYTRYNVPEGHLYPVFAVLILAATGIAAINAVMAWRLALDTERRRHFGWLVVASLLFIVGANALGIVNMAAHGVVPSWLGHLVLAGGMVAMAWNVAAYSLLIKGQVIRKDFFYFLTAIGLICVLYGGLFAFAGAGNNLSLLGLAVTTLILAILTHALTDIGRKGLDRFFYGADVQQLRANLASTIQSAGLTEDLPTVLNEAQQEIAQVSIDHDVRLTEQALRRLNNPATLAECELLTRIPRVISAARDGVELTPLERARVLREVLTAAIERLKPPEGDGIGAPGALQYHILREEYLQGLLNKQIMGRHSISEGTFHRNRRQAILTISRELETQERRFATATDRLATAE